MSIAFADSGNLTLGVEMQLQLLDRTTWDLTPLGPALIAALPAANPHIKHGIFQSMIEIDTAVCANANEIGRDLSQSVRVLKSQADKMGVALAANGTHPFAKYKERKIVATESYEALIDRNQWLARRLSIFGLHVHLGMRSGDHCIAMTNAFLRHAHMLLALSASSPFWQGQDTGLASSRTTIFEALPTAGHPCLVRDWEEFSQLIDKLTRSEAIRSIEDLWWDIRPSPSDGTMAIRICDGLTTVQETVALVAFTHALAVRLDAEIDGSPPPPLWLIRENKWRAARHGLEANVVVDDNGNTMSMRENIEQTLHSLKDIGLTLGYGEYFTVLKRLLASGGIYTRQRKIHAQTGSLEKVAQLSSLEFELDKPYYYHQG